MSENACSEQKLIEFFKKDFVPIDNVFEDTARRDAICMEARASLLIEANCTGDRFPAFMESGSHTPLGWVYKLSPKYTLKFTSFPLPVPLTLSFDEFLIANNRVGVDSGSSIVNRWQLYPSDYLHARVLEQKFVLGNMSDWDKALQPAYEQANCEFNHEYRSRFQLCAQVSPYKTPETICRFWGNRADIFADLKLSGMRPSNFSASEILDRDEYVQSDCTEEQQIQSYLERLIPCSTLKPKQTTLPNKYYEDWFCQVFPFRNEYGEIQMQLIKLYDPESQSKTLIPVTSWMRSQFPYNQCFCVPLPEDGQPLYNLDLLVKKETETVILTDSVELTDSNQRHAPDGVVFTSFICSPGRYEQVDWSPLQDKEVIVYLICNHSGISLEAAYLKARELADFLQDQYDIKLKFVQMKVDYPSCYFKSVGALQEAYRKQPAEINSASVMLLENDADFDAQYRKAVEFIHSKPREWWESQADVSAEEKRITDKESKKRIPPAYLLRPFLLRGEASMLYASKSTGKSALALSMAAAIVSGKPLFVEKWWTVPEPQNYPLNKVLYLDFENGKEEIEQRKIDFAYPYWPQDKTERERCKDNLIIEDMTSRSGKDYSLPENWQDIINLIDAAKHKGIEGQPVDLLVIDTMTKFSRKPYTATLNVSDFINKLRGLNLAILLVHHEGSNGEVRGWKCGLDDVYFNLRLYRERDKNEKDVSPVGKCTVKDLDEPLILAYHNARTSIEKIPAFEIRFDKKWVEYYREDDPNSEKTSEERRREELKQIVAHYSKKNLEHQDIYPILGIGKETYCKLRR